MFAAKPFVATDAGGTADLALELQQPDQSGIRQAANGFIVSRDADSILACLKKLAGDDSLRSLMGERGPGACREELGQ